MLYSSVLSRGISSVKKMLVLFFVASILLLVLLFLPSFIKTTNNTTAVIQEIRSLNRWETAAFTIEKIIDQKTDGNAVQQFLFGEKILLIAHGEVIAGFNLGSFSSKNIRIHNNSITLTLPSPEIFYTVLDSNKTRVYDKQQGILTHPDATFESRARLTAEQDIRIAACEENILTIASNNARKQLTLLLSAFHFTTITITIPEAKC